MASNFDFEWNYSHSMIIKRKGLVGREFNKYFADLVADYSDEFVPYHEGDLSSYVQTFGAEDHGTVTYQMPYANRHYLGDNIDESKRDRRFHPKATSYWDKAAWEQYGPVISRKLNEYRKAHSV